MYFAVYYGRSKRSKRAFWRGAITTAVADLLAWTNDEGCGCINTVSYHYSALTELELSIDSYIGKK